MRNTKRWIGKHRKSITVSAISVGLLVASAAPSFATYYHG
jgi:hypothetical protein